MVDIAIKNGARLLLTCDSDTWPVAPVGGLGEMYDAMSTRSAAVIGAAVATRNGNRMNCEPANPGEIYDGEVGTGYMLLDLWRLRDLPRPWFVHADTPDGLRVECGEDIYFCRKAKAAGHRVLVHFGISMAHADQHAVATHGS